MLNYKKFAALVLAVLLLGTPGLVPLTEACVGRKLTIGYRNVTEQAILSELLGILIEERTGTKIVFKEMEDSQEAHRALEANEIQIFVEYTGVGLQEILGEESNGEHDPKKIYRRVKKAYSKNFNLIWLKTFGFTGKSDEIKDKSLPLYAAPVVRKDTLEKFPALARLINKLKGKIDNNTMGRMIAKVEQEGKNPKEVAGNFLVKLGIAFSLTPGQA